MVIQLYMAGSTCLGAILTNPDGRRECLGEFRFDEPASEKMALQDCSFRNLVIDDKGYVFIQKDIQIDSTEDLEVEKRWRKFPPGSLLVWWYGLHGNFLEMFLDEPQ